MNQKETKIKVKFIFPDKQSTEYSLTEIDALELEIYANTSVPRRIIRTIRRLSTLLIGNSEIPMDNILQQSRSGNVYKALKYLEYCKIVEYRKDVKVLRIISQEKLQNLLNKIEELLEGLSKSFR